MLLPIVRSLPDREYIENDGLHRGPKPTVAELTAKTEHYLQHAGIRYICIRCHTGACSRDPQFKHWLALPCNTTIYRSVIKKKTLPCTENLHVGNHTIHNSHTLKHYRGLVYCSKCRCLARRKKLGNLSNSCTPPGRYGKRKLQYLSQDKLPYGMESWPADRVSSG